MEKKELTLRFIDNPTPDEEKLLHEIYTISFPPEERRPWQNMFEGKKSVDCPELFAIELKDLVEDSIKIAGLITLWNLDGVKYVEHFAISPSMRSLGLGQKVLSLINGVMILEVEPPEISPEAERRIEFYHRNGFNLSDIDYIQPPYAPDLPELPLRLMTRGNITNIQHTVSLLKKRVYHANSD